jgi:hypothetical protein
MAEIKSTLDLIMERTAELNLSDQEKAELKNEERRRKVKGLAVRLLEGNLGPAALEREASTWEGENRERLGRELAWELLSLTDLDRPGGTDLDQVLGILLGERGRSVYRTLKEVQQRYRDETAGAEADKREELLRELDSRGIRGTSLRPRVEGGLDQEPFKAGLREIIFSAGTEG